MSNKRICSNCQAEISQGAKFCPDCGTAVQMNPKKIKTRHKAVPKQSANFNIIYLVAVMAIIVTAIYGYRYFSPVEKNDAHQHDAPTAAAQPALPKIDQNMLKDLQSAFDRNPQGMAENVNLGNFYFDNQRFGQAKPFYETALRIDPNNTNVIVDYGVCYFNEQNFDKAKEYFNRALKLDPRQPNALYNLGVVAAQLGNMEEMVAVWTKLIEVAPESGPAATARQMMDRIKNQM